MRPLRPYRRRRFVIAWFSVTVFAACADSTAPPVGCDRSASPSVRVFVRDAATGAYVASGATLLLREGAFADSAVYPGGQPAVDPLPLSTPNSFERPGTYSVTVRKAEYASWIAAGVEVRSGLCHVSTVELTAQLVPLG